MAKPQETEKSTIERTQSWLAKDLDGGANYPVYEGEVRLSDTG